MEQLSTAEIIELAYMDREYFGNQFQYWLALTFAVITATYAAGNSLPANLRRFMALSYLLATALFVQIYIGAITEYNFYVEALQERDLPLLAADARGVRIGVLRMALWLLGTVITLWFLLTNRGSLHKQD